MIHTRDSGSASGSALMTAGKVFCSDTETGTIPGTATIGIRSATDSGSEGQEAEKFRS
jgi:hypothetical protein